MIFRNVRMLTANRDIHSRDHSEVWKAAVNIVQGSRDSALDVQGSVLSSRRLL